MDIKLTENQKKVLYIYSLYSSDEKLEYMQYTSILAICYYLMKMGKFPEYKEDILVYDYLDARRYLWEDKTFMKDINILRGYNLLLRARVRSLTYRDINSHRITEAGSRYIKGMKFEAIDKILFCSKCRNKKRKSPMDIVIGKNGPYLKCKKNHIVKIDGFLKDEEMAETRDSIPYFL